MALQTPMNYVSLFNWAVQHHFAEIAWRRATLPSANAHTQFELEHQKRAFIQKLVEVVRKCCQTNTPQTFFINTDAHKSIEESAEITSSIHQ